MKTYLNGLVRKTIASAHLVRPRLASIFEPLQHSLPVPAFKGHPSDAPGVVPAMPSAEDGEPPKPTFGSDTSPQDVHGSFQPSIDTLPEWDRPPRSSRPASPRAYGHVPQPHRGLLVPATESEPRPREDAGSAEVNKTPGGGNPGPISRVRETLVSHKAASPRQLEWSATREGRPATRIAHIVQAALKPSMADRVQKQMVVESRRAEQAQPGMVSVTIGRVEVTAVPLPPKPMSKPRPETARPTSLAEYLRRRTEDRGK